MHIKAGMVAFTGASMALGVVFVLLGCYIDSSTLFFLVLAVLLEGLVARGISLPAALMYLAGTTILSFFLAPQKLYVCTFLLLGLYVALSEWLIRRFDKQGIVWLIKCAIYQLLLFSAVVLTLLVFADGFEVLFTGGLLTFAKEHPMAGLLIALLAAEVFWIFFDRVYFYFMDRYSGKLLDRLLQR